MIAIRDLFMNTGPNAPAFYLQPEIDEGAAVAHQQVIVKGLCVLQSLLLPAGPNSQGRFEVEIHWLGWSNAVCVELAARLYTLIDLSKRWGYVSGKSVCWEVNGTRMELGAGPDFLEIAIPLLISEVEHASLRQTYRVLADGLRWASPNPTNHQKPAGDLTKELGPVKLLGSGRVLLFDRDEFRVAAVVYRDLEFLVDSASLLNLDELQRDQGAIRHRLNCLRRSDVLWRAVIKFPGKRQPKGEKTYGINVNASRPETIQKKYSSYTET